MGRAKSFSCQYQFLLNGDRLIRGCVVVGVLKKFCEESFFIRRLHLREKREIPVSLSDRPGFPIEGGGTGGGHSTMEVIPPLVRSVPTVRNFLSQEEISC